MAGGSVDRVSGRRNADAGKKQIDNWEIETHRHTSQLELIHKVTRQLIGELKLEKLLSETVDLVRDSFDYYGVMLLMLNSETQCLNLHTISGGYTSVLPSNLCIRVGEGMIGQAAASGKTQLSGDVTQNPHYVCKAKEVAQSELSIPIKSGDTVIAVLDLQSDKPDAFDETDVMVMKTLANNIAVAIKNAHLYAALNQELSKSRQAEEALTASEKKYRHLVENLDEIIFTTDEKGLVNYVSSAVQKITGYRSKEFIGSAAWFGHHAESKRYLNIIYPDDESRVTRIFENALKTASRYSAEYRIVKKEQTDYIIIGFVIRTNSTN